MTVEALGRSGVASSGGVRVSGFRMDDRRFLRGIRRQSRSLKELHDARDESPEPGTTFTDGEGECFGHEALRAACESLGDVDRHGLLRTDRLLLGLETRRDGETFGLGSHGTCLANLLEPIRFAVSSRLDGACAVLGDLDADLGLGEVSLLFGATARSFELDACFLSILLLAERLLLLVRNFAILEDGDDVGRQNDVLDVHAANFDVVFAQLASDVFLRCALHLVALLDEVDRGHLLKRVAEVVAHRRLQHLVDEVLHATDDRDDLRCFSVGDVNLNLQVDREFEAFLGLRHNRAEILIETVRLRGCRCPVERENERRNDFPRIRPRVDRELTGAQRFLPDTAVTRTDERAELEVGARRVDGREADVGLHDRHLPLIDHEHRNELDGDQERVQVVGAVEQRIVLEADAAAGIQELLEVLIVVVLGVLAREQNLDDLAVLLGRLSFLWRFECRDVVEVADTVRHRTLRRRSAFEGGDDADHIDDSPVTLRSRLDPDDLQLIGGEAERVVRQGPAFLGEMRILVGHGHAIDVLHGDDEEANRMNRCDRARRENGALNALFAVAVHEHLDVFEVAELRLVDA